MHPKEEICTPLLILVLNSNESSDPFNEVILLSSDIHTCTSSNFYTLKKHGEDDDLHAHEYNMHIICVQKGNFSVFELIPILNPIRFMFTRCCKYWNKILEIVKYILRQMREYKECVIE